MKDKRLFFRCFAKSLLISLLLWAAAMGAMRWVNHRWSWEDIISQQYGLPNAITQGTTSFAIPAGSEEGEIRPWEKDRLSVMLTMNSCDTLKKYGGQFFVRVYDREGERLGQSQMLAGRSAVYQPDGTAEERYLLFDPPLTGEGQVAAARILNGYSDHSFWTGGAGDQTGPDKIELTGWEEGEVIYARTLTLYFGEEAVDNLADNALRHCPPGGTVTVALSQRGKRVTLTVDNDGPVIPPEQLDRLFEPFWRGDAGRGREGGGTGLGLAIVRSAAEACDGRCWAVNRTDGVVFTLTLPGLQRGG